MLEGIFFMNHFILKKIPLLFCFCILCFEMTTQAQDPQTQDKQAQNNKAQDNRSLKDTDKLVLASQIDLPPLSKKEIKKYLSGQKPQWPDGTPIIIVLYPKGSAEMRWLCSTLLKLNENMYRRFLHQKAFRTGFNLIEVQNQEEAQKLLKQHSGAIAPIHKDFLSDSIHSLEFNN